METETETEVEVEVEVEAAPAQDAFVQEAATTAQAAKALATEQPVAALDTETAAVARAETPSGPPAPVTIEAAAAPARDATVPEAPSTAPVAAPPPRSDLPTAGPPADRPPIGDSEGTAAVWRVLEGIAAGLALAFLATLALKWRRSRRVDRP